jgi:hypothetical protein
MRDPRGLVIATLLLLPSAQAWADVTVGDSRFAEHFDPAADLPRRLEFSYLPGTGTELTLNGRRLALIEGADFARAYFAIWLGHRPLDEPLRDRLLARAD